MNNRTFFWLNGIRATILFCCCLATNAAPATAGNGMTQLNAFFADVKSFRAEFQQQVRDRQSDRVQSSSGMVALQRPGRFRWDYAQPYKQEIVGDGKKVWIYDEDLAQVTVRDQEQTLGNTPAQLLTSAVDLNQQFVINELGPRDGRDWVELTPKADDTTFQSIRLAFAKNDLVAMELRDSLGNTTELVFRNLNRNPKIDPETFVFTPPQGVDVIGQ